MKETYIVKKTIFIGGRRYDAGNELIAVPADVRYLLSSGRIAPKPQPKPALPPAPKPSPSQPPRPRPTATPPKAAAKS